MKNMILLFVLIAIGLVACVGPKSSGQREHAVVIRKGPGKLLLSITKQEWRGVYGEHGYEGYRTVGYWAALEGPGPTFANPHFQDNPSGFRCTGTITLDLERMSVTVDMRRIVSGLGEPERTKPHPANGTYSIEEIRDAKLEEAWF